MVTYLGSLFRCVVGREGHCKQMSLVCVGSACSVWNTLSLPQLAACAFQVYTAQASGCSAGAPSKAGPAFCALPRSKPLGCRFSHTLQGHRLGWARVLCPFQVRAAQATSAWQMHCFRWAVHLNHLPCPGRSVSWVCHMSPLGN